MLKYPPYCDLLVCGFVGDTAKRAGDAANYMFENIKKDLAQNPDLRVVILGPTVCSVPKISGKYRFRMLIKCKNNKKLRDIIRNNLAECERCFKDVTAFADMNPENII